MPHEWDRNSPTEGWATCANCGINVKNYRIRKGGLPTCDEYTQQQRKSQKQSKLDEKPPCQHYKSSLACLKCPGRFDTKLCDNLRRRLIPLKPPLTAKPPQKTEKQQPAEAG